MSIDYSPVLGVGVNQEEITYDNLTEKGKDIIRKIYLEVRSDLDAFGCDKSDEVISEWFDENVFEYDLFYELGLDEYEGNLFAGWYGNRGVHISVYDLLNGEDVAGKAKEEFLSIVNLEPKVFYGVLVS